MDNEKHQSSSDNSRLLELEREAQELRLGKEDLESKVNCLTNEIERTQLQQEELIKQAVTTEMQHLAEELAGPIAQLLTQEYLYKTTDKPIGTGDILILARQIIRVCEGKGIELLGQTGEMIKFNSKFHECLGSQDAPPEGTEVLIRMTGIAYKGRVLRRAAVTL